MSTDKPVVITITVQPMKGNKRPVTLAGAIEGKMPIFKTGLFADLHTLLDDVYIEASTHKGAAVKTSVKAKAGAKSKRKAKPKAKADQLVHQATEEQPAEIDETADEPEALDETEGESLPTIEGDDAPTPFHSQGQIGLGRGQLNLLEVDNG